MFHYLIRRVMWAVVLFVAVTIVTYIILYAVPANPARLACGQLATPECVQRAAHYIGLGMSSLTNVLGPEVVIIGGGVAGALGDPFVDLIRVSARRHMLTDPDEKIKIVRAALGDDAGVLGASLLARERFIAQAALTT